MKRWRLLLGLVVLLAVGAGLYVRFGRVPATQEAEAGILRTATVTRGDLEITVVASGNVAVKRRADLRFGMPGKVREVYVTAGERVEAGAPLARLDTEELEWAVRQAEIALEQARLELDDLTAPVDEAELSLAELAVQSAAQALEVARLAKQEAQADADTLVVQAQRDRERAFSLYVDAQESGDKERKQKAYEQALEQEAIAHKNAEAMVQQAEEQWSAAYRQYRQAVWELEQLRRGPTPEEVRLAELQVARAELEVEQARDRLHDALLTAPFAGLVTAVNVQEGLPTPPQAPAFTLVDDSALYVEVTVDEMDIGKVAVGQEAEVTVDAYPALTMAGRVDRIAPLATNIGGVVAYAVRLRLTETQGAQVRDGMTANVVLHVGHVEDALLVPNWAVRTDQGTGETYTYVLDEPLEAGGMPRRVAIVPGSRNETYTEILDGLREGETVVLLSEARNLPLGRR